LKEEDLSGDKGIERGLRWMLRNTMGKHEVESSGISQRQVATYSEQGNKPSGSIKSGEFLTG
jgi:hypothetical protein